MGGWGNTFSDAYYKMKKHIELSTHTLSKDKWAGKTTMYKVFLETMKVDQKNE